MQKHLTYFDYAIVFQEVPDEVSLAIEVGGCIHKCAGCHSPHLWKDSKKILIYDILNLLSKYGKHISCVCLMGGDHNKKDIISIFTLVKTYGLKTCLYTGCDQIEEVEDVLFVLDYLKIGRYKSELGGLDSINSNQKLYKVIGGKITDDLTWMFRKTHLSH